MPAFVLQGLGEAVVDNVITEQFEAPDWSSVPAEYSLLVKYSPTSEAEQLQVVSSGITEDMLVESSASYSGAFINVNGYLEGEEIGEFYGDSASIFYSPDGTIEFYSAEYKRIEYSYFFTVDPADAGSNLTVEVTLADGFNENLTYLPPDYNGDPLAFPGSVPAEAGQYTFTLIVPQQQLPQPPIIQEITTRLDVPDVEERFGDVSVAAGGTRLPIVADYRMITVVNLTLQDDGGTAVTARVIDKDTVNGPLVRVYDDTGTSVSGTIDAIVQGY